MEFQFGDFGGTLAMFVQAVSRQEPFSRKESLRYYMEFFVLLFYCGTNQQQQTVFYEYVKLKSTFFLFSC